jgi:tRNA(Ile)-lysidine synthase
LHFSTADKKAFSLNKVTDIAQLDFDKIKYPLMWRSWQAGDYFIPLGLGHSKKLSDFFIDMKLSMPEKNKVTVIESAGKIVWVVGLRIHDHFKISESTTRILTVRFEKNKD